MKKLLYAFFVLTLVFIYSCQKKSGNGNSVTSGSSNGSSQGTYITIGGSGWSFGACSTSETVFTASLNGSPVSATLTLGSPAMKGESKQYTLTSVNPTENYCRLVIDNPPGQLPNTKWYSRWGVVDVTSTITTTVGTFNCSFYDVECYQPNVYAPRVIAEGYMVCQ